LFCYHTEESRVPSGHNKKSRPVNPDRTTTYSPASPYRRDRSSIYSVASATSHKPVSRRVRRRPRYRRQVETIIEVDEEIAMSDGELNEVAQYSTLDGRRGMGAFEYSGHQWLQNRPTPQEVNLPDPPTPKMPFSGSPDALVKNDELIKALKAAPDVLYERFCQFGQLGVLGWCAEFSELIDEVKALGFSGEMASATRDCALETCREILKLNLEVKMQLIIIYLSGQISRLREFLDETENDDYPVPTFPLPSSSGEYP